MTIAAEQFVLLTSFKRDGSGVGTPVWIAPLEDGRAGFTTHPGTWKVKRINRTSRVTLQPCTRLGKPIEGREVVEATAVVHDDDPTVQVVTEAIASKYGLQAKAVGVIETVVGKVRRSTEERVVVVLRLPS